MFCNGLRTLIRVEAVDSGRAKPHTYVRTFMHTIADRPKRRPLMWEGMFWKLRSLSLAARKKAET